MNEPKLKHGQIVFLITDEDQSPRMITAYTVRPTVIVYELSFGTQTSWNHEIEIATELDIIKKLNSPRDNG